MPDGLCARTYAKLNLTLEVLRRREDGYHDLSSVVHTIGLADELRVAEASQLTCWVEGLSLTDEENLVLRAARLLQREAGIGSGASIRLRKAIPVAAGLGGGSSDAASALVLLSRLWGVHMSHQHLVDLAARLGSDVPFFLRGGAAVMSGRGDTLMPLPALGTQWFVVLVPRHTVVHKTALLYESLADEDFADGTATHRLATSLRDRGCIDEALLRNSFARAARASFPSLRGLWPAAERLCSRPLHLSGAGPALFALARDRTDARAAATRLASLGQPVYVARSVSTGRSPRKMPYP